MNYTDKTVGIWGYGRVGKAAAAFLQKRGASILIYDKKPIQADAAMQVATSIDQLFGADYILPSPGIDTRSYRTRYEGTWLSELDLFYHFFTKPIIAITGSVGKTTVTTLLAQALTAAGWRVQAAGNIGIPCLQIIEQQDQFDTVVLEVSSFQLEYAQSFAPDLAIWTNFYPNHLDRHGSMQEYFAAKQNLIKYQTATQFALLPTELSNEIKISDHRGHISFFGSMQDGGEVSCYFIEQQNISVQIHGNKTTIMPLEKLDHTVFPINWLVVYAALHLLKVPPPTLTHLQPIAHRLERVTTVSGITFYNDSKSTTPASTLTALSAISAPHTILFLGGLSKGVDRTDLIQFLQSRSVIVICFGHEAIPLRDLCLHYHIPAHSFATLQEAFLFCTTIAQPNDSVLLSPAGTSFDLFKHYEERGDRFKELVYQYKKGSAL